MFKEFFLHLMLPPSRMSNYGAVLSRISFALIIAGCFLQVGLKSVAVLQSMSRVDLVNVSIEQMFPGLPTWLIPESAEGFVFWFVVFVLGLYCQYLAKEIKRVYYWNT